ncbi:hypothetical protein J6590_026030 [Homalodisca vitripennis]|nr:hypothetical protein J6590_026030 [Homalodisca vitripennis]
MILEIRLVYLVDEKLMNKRGDSVTERVIFVTKLRHSVFNVVTILRSITVESLLSIQTTAQSNDEVCRLWSQNIVTGHINRSAVTRRVVCGNESSSQTTSIVYCRYKLQRSVQSLVKPVSKRPFNESDSMSQDVTIDLVATIYQIADIADCRNAVLVMSPSRNDNNLTVGLFENLSDTEESEEDLGNTSDVSSDKDNSEDGFTVENAYLEEKEEAVIAVRELAQNCLTLEIDVESLKQKHTLPVPSHSLTLKNRYEALETLNDQDTTGFTTVTSKKKNKGTKIQHENPKFSKKQYLYDKNKRKTAHTKTSVPFRNVTVIGDSHVRNLSAILRRRTSASNIVGVCKPGAGLLQIKTTNPPPEDHCFVLIAGTNDLATGRQDIIYQHMEEIIQQYSSNSKVLVSPLLPRHDLPRDSPVHKKVALANNYISELCERYKGAAFLDISDLSRHHFTAHGLHLTTAGKAILADLIVKGLNSPPRTFNRTPAESAPRPPLPPPTPPPPPTSAQGHNTYAEAVTQRPAGASTLPTTKTVYGVNKNNAVFLGTPDTSAGLN